MLLLSRSERPPSGPFLRLSGSLLPSRDLGSRAGYGLWRTRFVSDRFAGGSAPARAVGSEVGIVACLLRMLPTAVRLLPQALRRSPADLRRSPSGPRLSAPAIRLSACRLLLSYTALRPLPNELRPLPIERRPSATGLRPSATGLRPSALRSRGQLPNAGRGLPSPVSRRRSFGRRRAPSRCRLGRS